MRVPFNEMSTCEKRLCRNRLIGPTGASSARSSPLFCVTSLYIQHGVCKVDVVFSRAANVELDGRTVGHGRHRMVFDPTALFHTSLSRWYVKKIQLPLCTFARLFVNESHLSSSANAGTRLTNQPFHRFFIPAGTRFFADSFTDLPSKLYAWP